MIACRFGDVVCWLGKTFARSVNMLLGPAAGSAIVTGVDVAGGFVAAEIAVIADRFVLASFDCRLVGGTNDPIR